MHKGDGPLTPTSQRFVQSTPTHALQTGLKAVVEITAYPDGKFGLAVSKIGGTRNARTLTIANSFMLNDAEEAKDHTDAIIDFLLSQSTSRGAQQGDSVIQGDEEG